jgi:hypothetical protein
MAIAVGFFFFRAFRRFRQLRRWAFPYKLFVFVIENEKGFPPPSLARGSKNLWH